MTGVIDKLYISGMASALIDAQMVPSFDDFPGVIEKVADDLQAMAMGGGDPSMMGADPSQAGAQPGSIADQADPDQLEDVAQSGLTEKDIESAAKVIQVISEMKQKADAAAGQLPPGAPGAGGAQPGQPPLPQAPQPPMPAGAGQPPPPPQGGQPKTASERWGSHFRKEAGMGKEMWTGIRKSMNDGWGAAKKYKDAARAQQSPLKTFSDKLKVKTKDAYSRLKD